MICDRLSVIVFIILNLDRDEDRAKLIEDWKTLTSKTKAAKITYGDVEDLAKKHNFLNGKWMLMMLPGENVDSIWRKLVLGLNDGMLPPSVIGMKINVKMDELIPGAMRSDPEKVITPKVLKVETILL